MKETKDKIVLKALQYFIKNDYESVSLSSIAEGIGITKGGIYHYFSSKDELFLECIITVFEMVREFSADAMSENASLEEVLESLFSFNNIFQMMSESLNMDFVSNYMDYSYLMFVGIKKFPKIAEMVTIIYDEMQQGLELMFLDQQAKGIIKKDINCKILAFEIVAMIEGAMLVSGFTTGTDLKEVGKDLVKSTLARICV